MRTRFKKLQRAQERSALGMPEIIALAASGLLLVVAIFSYFFFLAPGRSRLESARQERERLTRQIQNATEGFNRSQSTEASVEEIVNSLQNFEADHLTRQSEGSTALIEELNRLIRRNNLRISAGMSFTQFEQVVPGGGGRQPQTQRQAAAGTAKALQGVFPGIGVSLTVEGPYPNLRRFIREIEADRQFIVINAVELEGVAGGRPSRAAGEGAGEAEAVRQDRGSLVSLRLDMATYFRRFNTQGQTSPQ